MKLWIAKNRIGYLELHSEKPSLHGFKNELKWSDTGLIGMIKAENFPEITIENSPQQVEIKIIEK